MALKPDKPELVMLVAELHLLEGDIEACAEALGGTYEILCQDFFGALSSLGRNAAPLERIMPFKSWQIRLILTREFTSLHGKDSLEFMLAMSGRTQAQSSTSEGWFALLKQREAPADAIEPCYESGCMADVRLMLQDRRPRVLNPLTGKLSASVLSLLPDLALLRDSAENVFVSCAPLLIASQTYETSYLLPERRLIVNLIANRDQGKQVRQLLTPDLNYLLNNLESIGPYANMLKESRGIILADRPIDHLGHYVWNRISAWENVIAGHVWNKAEQLVSWDSGHYFGPLSELYPELKTSKHLNEKLNSTEEATDLIRRSGAFWLPMFDRYIRSEEAKRISSACARNASEKLLATMEDLGGSGRPIILLTVRHGNRVWMEQTEGYANIIIALRKRYPQASFVIDGMNATHHNCSTHRYMDTQAEAQTARTIIESVGQEIPVIDTIGAPIADSVAICRDIDMFIAPWGTAMTKYKWITNKPGVAIGNRISADPGLGCRGTRVFDGYRDNALPAVDIGLQHIKDSGFGNREDALRENFSIAWQVIYKSADSLLQSLGFEPID